MLNTYRAILEKNRIIWQDEIPLELEKDAKQNIIVIFQENSGIIIQESNKSDNIKLKNLLEKLALANKNSNITDPVKWQKEIRKDRSLPGRD